MKRVLIVAYYFPPVAASGAMRPLAFCRFLESYGWTPRVLTADPSSVHPPQPVDRALTAKVPPEVRVDAVSHGNPLQRVIAARDRARDLLRGRRTGRAGERVSPAAPEPRSRQARSTSIGMVKDFILDWGFVFPDPQCSWFKPAVAFARHIPRTEVPDVVFATGGPWTSLLVGQRLASHWGVPFVADYRDPWTSNPYVSFNAKSLNERARRLEGLVVGSARRVITNTHELREQLQKDYPGVAGKALTIMNGFDPDSFGSIAAPPVDQPGSRPASDGTAPLEIFHFGTVYGKRTPIVLLQALQDLSQAGRVSADRLCLRFTGAWEVDDPGCEELAKNLEKVGLLRREPPIPYEACLQRMSRAGALLVIQPDSPLQIPGKIYEYVAARRPLLLVGGDGATANLVNRHRLGLTCANEGMSIRRLLDGLAGGAISLPIPSQEEIDRFNYRSLTGDLACVLDEVHREHAARR